MPIKNDFNGSIPGPIGGGSASSGAFTTLSASGQTTLSGALADSTTSTGTTGQAPLSTGTGWAWGTIPLPRSYLGGLAMANNSTNSIDLAVGATRDSTNVYNLVLASALTKQLGVLWVVGTNQGGLDTGAVGDGTYHLFVIARPGTGVIDALFSLSPTTPTLPTNYTYFRRIGSLVRASGAILPFSQAGDEFKLVTPIKDVDTATLTTSSSTFTLASIPTGVRMMALLQILISHATSADVYLRDLTQADVAAAGSTGFSTIRSQVATVSISAQISLRTNTSSQVAARSSAAATTLRLTTVGWNDRRGRDD